MTPARGLVTLRRIETPDTLPAGHILLTSETREQLTQCQMEVVAIGAPASCMDDQCERPHLPDFEDDRTHPVGVHRGDWVVVRHRSLTATHEDGLYCCPQDAILAVLQP